MELVTESRKLRSRAKKLGKRMDELDQTGRGAPAEDPKELKAEAEEMVRQLEALEKRVLEQAGAENAVGSVEQS